MKKIISIILLFTLVFSCFALWGCIKHEHSFKYIYEGKTHLKQYTCNCSLYDVSEFHSDNDYDSLCDKCKNPITISLKTTSKEINIKDNYVFFPTERSNLNCEELKDALIEYRIDNNQEIDKSFEVYNFVGEEDGEKYNLDVFQAVFEDYTYYYVKYGKDIYCFYDTFTKTKAHYAITNMAITDINDDGYFEILVAMAYFTTGNASAKTEITVIDTHTKHTVSIDYRDTICYLKENDEGIVSIYSIVGMLPNPDNLINGKLDELYYDLADELLETPTLNTAKYEFASHTVKASCDLFSVKVTVTDMSIDFPYLFERDYYDVYFNVNVEMTYLGKTFRYLNDTLYLDGAVATFVNDTDQIKYESWFECDAISEIVIVNGMVIDRTYRYVDCLKYLNSEGLYDMIITYEVRETGLKESIVIEDFLMLTR